MLIVKADKATPRMAVGVISDTYVCPAVMAIEENKLALIEVRACTAYWTHLDLDPKR